MLGRLHRGHRHANPEYLRQLMRLLQHHRRCPTKTGERKTANIYGEDHVLGKGLRRCEWVRAQCDWEHVSCGQGVSAPAQARKAPNNVSMDLLRP
jgi:hypothetical protein